jgi:hypothetical protein
MTEQQRRDPIEDADQSRRSFLGRVAKMGFAAPVVASFSMSGMMAGPAYAYGNLSQ